MRGWLIATVAVLALAACGTPAQVVDVGNAPTRGGDTAPTSALGTPDETATAALSGAGEPPPDAAAQAPADPDQQAGTDPATSVSTTVVVYLTQGEQIRAVPRVVNRVPRIGSVAVEQLLAGPNGGEQAAGYGTEIPASTRLRGLTITDGVATVDLSGDFESGGGTLGLTLRLAQVACTLDQFPTVDGVRFALDGTVVDVFSGDGLIIDEPVACSDYADVVAG